MKSSKIFTILLSACFTCLVAQSSHARDTVANGKKLYMQGCTGCHNTDIHTRPNKIIFSKQAIIKRVKFCDTMAGNKFNDEQISDIAEYLNQTFYKYDD